MLLRAGLEGLGANSGFTVGLQAVQVAGYELAMVAGVGGWVVSHLPTFLALNPKP